MGAPEAVTGLSVDTEEGVLRVGGNTSPQDLAAAIANACYEKRPPRLRAIGAGAVNQAIKGCAIARQFVSPRAMDLTLKPGFETLKMQDGEISAIVLQVIID